MNSNHLYAVVLGTAIAAIIILVIEVLKRTRGVRSLIINGGRKVDGNVPGAKAGDIYKYDPKIEGHPGGPRGVVWTELDRQRYRDKQRATIARVAGHTCPPHVPDYDESVDETYCLYCLARLPNE